MFLVPKEAEMSPKAPQKASKTVPKGIQSAVENRLLKTDRVFLDMDAKTDSKSDLN